MKQFSWGAILRGGGAYFRGAFFRGVIFLGSLFPGGGNFPGGNFRGAFFPGVIFPDTLVEVSQKLIVNIFVRKSQTTPFEFNLNPYYREVVYEDL